MKDFIIHIGTAEATSITVHSRDLVVNFIGYEVEAKLPGDSINFLGECKGEGT